MKKRGAEILIEELKHLGVEVIFGIPGGSVIPLMDALYDEKDLRFILCRHEQGAAHAADGYARATGKVGVCLTTSGPGATNLVTGIATANFDSVPMVAITGQVKTHLIGNDAFQEADTTGITRSISKHNYLIRDCRDLARTVREAFHLASTGRPGPVVIDLPVDVTVAECEHAGAGKAEIKLPGYKPVSYTHLRAHETLRYLVCRLLLEKKSRNRTSSSRSARASTTASPVRSTRSRRTRGSSTSTSTRRASRRPSRSTSPSSATRRSSSRS